MTRSPPVRSWLANPTLSGHALECSKIFYTANVGQPGCNVRLVIPFCLVQLYRKLGEEGRIQDVIQELYAFGKLNGWDPTAVSVQGQAKQ